MNAGSPGHPLKAGEIASTRGAKRIPPSNRRVAVRETRYQLHSGYGTLVIVRGPRGRVPGRPLVEVIIA